MAAKNRRDPRLRGILRRAAGLSASRTGDNRCECDDDAVPGAGWPFNNRAEVQRCDMCKRLSDDAEAATAVVARLNIAAVFGVVPAGLYGFKFTGPKGGHEITRNGLLLDAGQADELHTALCSWVEQVASTTATTASPSLARRAP